MFHPLQHIHSKIGGFCYWTSSNTAQNNKYLWYLTIASFYASEWNGRAMIQKLLRIRNIRELLRQILITTEAGTLLSMARLPCDNYKLQLKHVLPNIENDNHKYGRVAHLWEQIKVSCYYIYVLPVRLYHDNDYRYLLIEVELMVLLGTVSHIFVINNNNNWIISRLHVLSVYYIYEKIYTCLYLCMYTNIHIQYRGGKIDESFPVYEIHYTL